MSEWYGIDKKFETATKLIDVSKQLRQLNRFKKDHFIYRPNKPSLFRMLQSYPSEHKERSSTRYQAFYLQTKLFGGWARKFYSSLDKGTTLRVLILVAQRWIVRSAKLALKDMVHDSFDLIFSMISIPLHRPVQFLTDDSVSSGCTELAPGFHQYVKG